MSATEAVSENKSDSSGCYILEEMKVRVAWTSMAHVMKIYMLQWLQYIVMSKSRTLIFIT